MRARFQRRRLGAPSLCERWTNHRCSRISWSASARRCRRWPVRCSVTAARSTAPTRRWRGALAAVRSPAELLDDFAAAEPGTAGTGPLLPVAAAPRRPRHPRTRHGVRTGPGAARSAPTPLVAVLNTQVAVPNPFVPAFRNAGACGYRQPTSDGATVSGDRWSRAAPPTGVRPRQPAEGAAASAR